MYVQLLVFKTAPNMQAPVETLADNAYAALKNAPGFKSATYFGDPDTNEFGAFYVWETKEAMDAVMKEFMPKLQEAVNAVAVEPAQRKAYEGYEPKT